MNYSLKINLRKKNKLTKFIFLAVALLIINVLSVSSFAKNEEDPALALVNDDTIKVSDVDNLLIKQHTNLESADMKNFDYSKLLKQLVNNKLIIQEAYSLGMDQEDWIVEKMDEMMFRDARNLFINSFFKPDLTIDKDSILNFFNKYYFRLTLRTVSVGTKEEALKIIDKINNGAPMDSIAEAVSFDSKRFKGGLHRSKHYADIEPILRETADKLKVGELSEPTVLREVYVVIRLEDSSAANMEEYPFFENKITRILATEKKNILWDKFNDSLIEAYKPVENKELIEAIKADSTVLFDKKFTRHTTDSSVLYLGPDFKITDDKFRNDLSYSAMQDSQKPFDTLFNKAYTNLVRELVLSYAAFDNGCFDSSIVQTRYDHNLDSVMVNVFLSEMIYKQIKFNKEEFKEYYNNNPDEFREDARFQVAQIYTSNLDTAKIILQRLKEGANFDFLATQYDPDNFSGSNPKKWVTKESFPTDIGLSMEDMNIGDFTEIYQAETGYMIFQIKNKKEGHLKTFDEANIALREIFFQKKFSELLDLNLAKLKENSKIKYFNNNIKDYFGRNVEL